MKFGNKILGVLFVWLACTVVSCSESAVEELASSPVSGERQPIRLAVGSGVSVDGVRGEDTRGTNLGLQDDAFLPGTEVGLFVVREEQYNALMQAAGINDMPMVLDAGLDYAEYLNVHGVIQADGRIKLDDGEMLYYPDDPEEKVALLAYAPYDTHYTLLQLLTGFTLKIQSDQSADAGQVASDFVWGIPVVGNPFREPGIVTVGFAHLLTRVDLTLEVEPAPELLCESVEVKMTGVRNSYTVRPLLFLKDISIGFASGTASTWGDVTLARMPAWTGNATGTAETSEALQRQCCAIVIPEQNRGNNGRTSTFEITLKGRRNGRADTTIVRTDTVMTNFYPGKSVSYKIHLGEAAE